MNKSYILNFYRPIIPLHTAISLPVSLNSNLFLLAENEGCCQQVQTGIQFVPPEKGGGGGVFSAGANRNFFRRFSRKSWPL